MNCANWWDSGDVNEQQQQAFLTTFEQAGVEKVRKAITSDHWPPEVQELAENWLASRDETERRREAVLHEHMQLARFASDSAMTAGALAKDAKSLAQDANAIARAASASAGQTASRTMIGNVISAVALAVAIAALIAAAWPK